MQKAWFYGLSWKNGKVEDEILGLIGRYSIMSEGAGDGERQKSRKDR